MRLRVAAPGCVRAGEYRHPRPHRSDCCAAARDGAFPSRSPQTPHALASSRRPVGRAARCRFRCGALSASARGGGDHRLGAASRIPSPGRPRRTVRELAGATSSPATSRRFRRRVGPGDADAPHPAIPALLVRASGGDRRCGPGRFRGRWVADHQVRQRGAPWGLEPAEVRPEKRSRRCGARPRHPPPCLRGHHVASRRRSGRRLGTARVSTERATPFCREKQAEVTERAAVSSSHRDSACFSDTAPRNAKSGPPGGDPLCCGGWGIRTPEGFHPTRFPSVRHRPLGESS